MNWTSALINLFELNANKAGEIEQWCGNELILMPPGYGTMKAHLEISINEKGDFINAIKIVHDYATTIVPYPEVRTSGIKALPLCDFLIYVAGDYPNRVTTTDPDVLSGKTFRNYINKLSEWQRFDPENLKISALLKYIERKTIIADLLKSGILHPDPNGKVSESVKIQKEKLDKVFVRFRVLTTDLSLEETAIWLDQSVQRSFLKHYLSHATMKDLCYITGKHTLIAKTNPKKIRGEWDTKASLISSNDSSNFSYRGRFQTKDQDSGYNEAVAIGYEASQKIHNALKWIIRRQGFTRDGVCIVAWESNLVPLPKFYEGTIEILGAQSDEDFLGESETPSTDTNYVTAKELKMAIDGYSKEITNASKMVIMALDSATPGRLALIYYKELETSKYLDNIRKWQESCCWRHSYFDQTRGFTVYEGVPGLGRIAAAVYGTEQGAGQNKVLKLRMTENKCPMLISVFERLRPCIIEGVKIPTDIVKTSIQRASNPVVYDKETNFLHVLHTACSLVKKYYWDKGEKFDMNLDENCINRSYLFGRLLAVAEYIERKTFDRGETRTTNAERYMRQFSQTPLRTWGIIRKNTQVYLNQLPPGSREYYKGLYGKIEGLFEKGAFEEKKALDGRFLLGYDCQREALKRNNKKEELSENDEKFENENEE